MHWLLLAVLCTLVFVACIKWFCASVQLGKDLATQRKQLRLFRHPFRTLYYFAACAGSAAVRGSLWLVKHRITLTLLLPAIAGYIFLKQTGKACSTVAYAYYHIMYLPCCTCYRTLLRYDI